MLHGTNPRCAKFVPPGRRQGSYTVRSCIWASGEVAATQVEVDTGQGDGVARSREDRIPGRGIQSPAQDPLRSEEAEIADARAVVSL